MAHGHTKLWVAQHGWTYLHAIIDCCTREITAWTLDLRARTKEAIACLDHALAQRAIETDQLTLGTDNGPQFTGRRFRRHLTDRGITHRRGGYRDPESQAFIESWFGQFMKRLAWRAEWETLDHARKEITTHVTTYQHRPHAGIGYQTPTELATTWKRKPIHTRTT